MRKRPIKGSPMSSALEAVSRSSKVSSFTLMPTLSSIGITAAASRAVGYGSAKDITFATGLTEAPRRSRISPYSVVVIIAPSTRRASLWNDWTTAS